MVEPTKKNTPINKYSIYDLKSAVDTRIVEVKNMLIIYFQFLEQNNFKEHHTLSNLKIVVGIISLIFTGFAYLYPKPFPDNYYLILVCVIGYINFKSNNINFCF